MLNADMARNSDRAATLPSKGFDWTEGADCKEMVLIESVFIDPVGDIGVGVDATIEGPTTVVVPEPSPTEELGGTLTFAATSDWAVVGIRYIPSPDIAVNKTASKYSDKTIVIYRTIGNATPKVCSATVYTARNLVIIPPLSMPPNILLLLLLLLLLASPTSKSPCSSSSMSVVGSCWNDVGPPKRKVRRAIVANRLENSFTRSMSGESLFDDGNCEQKQRFPPGVLTSGVEKIIGFSNKFTRI